jgi:hypothetical protein
MSRITRLFVAAAAFALTTAPAHAQEFTWKNANSFEVGNVPGLIARMMGSGKETIETNHLSGNRLRTESGNSVTIIDVGAAHVVNLDTKAKTYTRLTFEEMTEALRQMNEEAEMQALLNEEPQGGQKAAAKEGEYDVVVDARVQQTDDRAQIAGVNARRALIHVTVKAVPKDEKQRRERGETGSLAFLIDTWNSTDAPHSAALTSFQQAMAEKLSHEAGSMRGLQMLFGQNPGMKDGWERAMNELRKVDGVALRHTTYIVGVPAGMQFDPQLALSPPQEEKESTGSRIGRGIGGRLRAAAGVPQEEQEREQAAAKQSTIITVKSELREVQQGGVPASAYEIPAGFKEAKPKK